MNETNLTLPEIINLVINSSIFKLEEKKAIIELIVNKKIPIHKIKKLGKKLFTNLQNKDINLLRSLQKHE